MALFVDLLKTLPQQNRNKGPRYAHLGHQTEDNYGSNDSFDLPSNSYPLRRGALLKSNCARLIIFAAIFVTLAGVFSLFYTPRIDLKSVLPSALFQDDVQSTVIRPSYLHMLVPASRVDAGLCKSLVSAAVLGYPPPVLINYKQEFGSFLLIDGGSHIAKIYGVLDYLRTLNASYDNDLVMIADGYDVWYQLPPNVLLERYMDINARANERITRELGDAAQGISQTVVFSAQKRCWPREESDAACYAVPESTLPRDIYGDDTDLPGAEPNPFAKYRQRYLNSGSCIGPVADVRAVFERAKEKADEDSGFGSDQGIFGDIFGEQEVHRRMLASIQRRQMSHTDDGNTSDASSGQSFTANDESPALEFGIGLDYESQIQLPTVFCEDETAWVASSDEATIESVTRDNGFPLPPRAGHLPESILDSAPPFHSHHSQGGLDPIPTSQAWNATVLFTHMWSGVSPVAIHHNAHRDGLKSRLLTDWSSTWYAPYLRALLDDRATSPERAIAITYDVQGLKQEWWAPAFDTWRSESASVRTDTGETIGFDTLCSGDGIWEEVMKDGKGPWLDPMSGKKMSAPTDSKD